MHLDHIPWTTLSILLSLQQALYLLCKMHGRILPPSAQGRPSPPASGRGTPHNSPSLTPLILPAGGRPPFYPPSPTSAPLPGSPHLGSSTASLPLPSSLRLHNPFTATAKPTALFIADSDSDHGPGAVLRLNGQQDAGPSRSFSSPVPAKPRSPPEILPPREVQTIVHARQPRVHPHLKIESPSENTPLLGGEGVRFEVVGKGKGREDGRDVDLDRARDGKEEVDEGCRCPFCCCLTACC